MVFYILQYYPQRLANMDESGFQWNPNGNFSVVVSSTEKGRVRHFGKIKTSTSVSFTVCADGTILKPLLMLPYKKSVPQRIINSIDLDYFDFIGGTGYSQHSTFLHYIKYVCYVI